jgi:hypothetical protein
MEGPEDSIGQIIDRIAVALGQRNFAHMRQTIGKAATFFMNLSIWAESIGSWSPEDFGTLISVAIRNDEKAVLRMLADLESALPTLRINLVRKLETLAPSLGGRPPKFKDRSLQRKQCEKILAYIMKGRSEPEAVRKVAEENGVTYQTMYNTWEIRPILNELSAFELIEEIIARLSKPDAPKPDDILPKEPAKDRASDTDDIK